MSIKTSFSIKDLENLSGIKAHTIRIWEKRYNLLKPERSDSNIRTYNIASLLKILNVAVLNQNGFKISKISELNEKELLEKVREATIGNSEKSVARNNFKMAMLNFDQSLFDKTYLNLLTKHSFREVFLNEFLILLEDIGSLWATNTISPMHERFTSTLIKQKILVNIEKIQVEHTADKKVYVLFLPLNELHDIGLLYLHYELTLKGYKTIFLGTSIPIQDLKKLQQVFKEIIYISYFTVEPNAESVVDYLKLIEEEVLRERSDKLHLLGKNAMGVNVKDISNNITIHKSLIELVETL